jgi:hypothetical protein
MSIGGAGGDEHKGAQIIHRARDVSGGVSFVPIVSTIGLVFVVILRVVNTNSYETYMCLCFEL